MPNEDERREDLERQPRTRDEIEKSQTDVGHRSVDEDGVQSLKNNLRDDEILQQSFENYTESLKKAEERMQQYKLKKSKKGYKKQEIQTDVTDTSNTEDEIDLFFYQSLINDLEHNQKSVFNLTEFKKDIGRLTQEEFNNILLSIEKNTFIESLIIDSSIFTKEQRVLFQEFCSSWQDIAVHDMNPNKLISNNKKVMIVNQKPIMKTVCTQTDEVGHSCLKISIGQKIDEEFIMLLFKRIKEDYDNQNKALKRTNIIAGHTDPKYAFFSLYEVHFKDKELTLSHEKKENFVRVHQVDLGYEIKIHGEGLEKERLAENVMKHCSEQHLQIPSVKISFGYEFYNLNPFEVNKIKDFFQAVTLISNDKDLFIHPKQPFSRTQIETLAKKCQEYDLVIPRKIEDLLIEDSPLPYSHLISAGQCDHHYRNSRNQ